jgi:hypothetical protein
MISLGGVMDAFRSAAAEDFNEGNAYVRQGIVVTTPEDGGLIVDVVLAIRGRAE